MKKKIPKPRNPFVQHLINKKGAGAHNKEVHKTERQKTKAALKKLLERPFFFNLQCS